MAKQKNIKLHPTKTIPQCRTAGHITDLLGKYAPKVLERFTIEDIASALEGAEICEWQIAAQPGEHFVRLCDLETPPDSDIICVYLECVAGTRERIASFMGCECDQPGGVRFELFRMFHTWERSSLLKDRSRDNYDEQVYLPWELHVPLTPTQFERMRNAGWPRRTHEMIAVLCGDSQ